MRASKLLPGFLRGWWLLAVLGAVALLGGWLLLQLSHRQIAQLGIHARPDIEFDDLQLSELVDGQGLYTLTAAYAAWYAARQSTSLRDVQVQVPESPAAHGQDLRPAYRFSANRGEYDMGSGEFLFTSVNLASPQDPSLRLQALQMRWQPGDELLSLEQGVRFARGNVAGQAGRALANLRSHDMVLWHGVQAKLSP